MTGEKAIDEISEDKFSNAFEKLKVADGKDEGKVGDWLEFLPLSAERETLEETKTPSKT